MKLHCRALQCSALTTLYRTVYHCTVLYCSVLYCTALLYCTVLHCTTVLYYTVLCCTVLHRGYSFKLQNRDVLYRRLWTSDPLLLYEHDIGQQIKEGGNKKKKKTQEIPVNLSLIFSNDEEEEEMEDYEDVIEQHLNARGF